MLRWDARRDEKPKHGKFDHLWLGPFKIVRSLKKLLAENKKAWDSKLKYAPWVDRITTKNAIGTSPFHFVYGTEAFFPIHLGLPVMKFMQDKLEEPNEIQHIIFQMIEIH